MTQRQCGTSMNSLNFAPRTVAAEDIKTLLPITDDDIRFEVQISHLIVYSLLAAYEIGDFGPRVEWTLH